MGSGPASPIEDNGPGSSGVRQGGKMFPITTTFLDGRKMCCKQMQSRRRTGAVLADCSLETMKIGRGPRGVSVTVLP